MLQLFRAEGKTFILGTFLTLRQAKLYKMIVFHSGEEDLNWCEIIFSIYITLPDPCPQSETSK